MNKLLCQINSKGFTRKPQTLQEYGKLREKIIQRGWTDLAETDFVEREMAIVRVKAEEGTRAEVLRTIDIFRGKVVDVGPKSYVVEITGSVKKIEAVLGVLKPIGIQEIVRTGTIAMARSKKS